jgi:Ca2+-binding RTX toxin-like protein
MATINGTSGNDTLRGQEGDDLLRGFGGDDTLGGGAGADTLNGGDGNDFYLLHRADPDQLLDSGGHDTVIARNQGYSLGTGFEDLVLRGTKSDDVPYVYGQGNTLDNVIRNERGGDWGITRLDGHDGNDTLIGGATRELFSFTGKSGDYGHDYVDGGGGSDLLCVGALSGAVVDLRDGTLRGGGSSGSGSATLTGIYQVHGGNFNDRLIGNDAGVRFFGGHGDDTLIGGAGDDFVDADTALEPDQWAYRSGNGSNLIIGRAGADYLLGGGGNDTIYGGSGADIIEGEGGTNRLYGGGGNDTFTFWGWDESNNSVKGGPGTDRLFVFDDLDLTALANHQIRDIEIIDSRVSSISPPHNHVLTLAKSDLLDISSTTNTLKVFGNAGDTVNIVGPYEDLGVSGRFHRYKLGAAMLLVDTEITNVG